MRPPPGFYSDPFDPSRLRFFDGVAWTAQTVASPPSSRPRRRSPFPPSTVSWSAVGWGALIAVVASTVTGVVGLLVVAFTEGVDAISTDSTFGLPPVLVFFGAFGLWVGFATAFIMACRQNGLSVGRALGPVRPSWSLAAAAAGLVAQASVVLAGVLLLGEGEGASPVESGPVGWLLLGLVLVVGAPVFEELFFRGVLLPTLAARWGTHPAVLVQAAVFGAVHFDQGVFGVVAIALVAVGLGYLRVHTQSVVPAIAMHATFNAAAFTLLALGG